MSGRTDISVQFGTSIEDLTSAQVCEWVGLARGNQKGNICVRFMDVSEASALNFQFRKKPGPTNVLSFNGNSQGILGDIAICVSVAEQEAAQQGKHFIAHLAHLVIHGVLHLCGFEHSEQDAAQRMEAKEIQIMESLGYRSPYECHG